MGFLSRFSKPSADDPPPTESWPLFAFGKLPVYKDFISAGLTDDASREFRDWLSNGFSRHWSTRDDFRSAEIPLHAFLLGLPESRKIAAGALWGSTDQGGLRKFPFALFTILPAGKPAAAVLSALDYLPFFESRAREIRRKYDAGGTLAAVYQDLRGARIEVPVRPQKQIRLRLTDALARSRVGPLAEALFGDDAATQWAALLSGLDAAARRPGAGPAAYRLPLAEGTPPLDQMKLWTLRLAQASPSGAVPAGVLYRTGCVAPRGVLFFRDARAEDILLLHPEAIATDYVEEIPPPVRRTPPEASATMGATAPEAAAPVAAEPAAAAAPPPPEAGSPAGIAPLPKAEPRVEPPTIEGLLRLGAAATGETAPATPQTAPAIPETAPAISETAPAIPETAPAGRAAAPVPEAAPVSPAPSEAPAEVPAGAELPPAPAGSPVPATGPVPDTPAPEPAAPAAATPPADIPAAATPAAATPTATAPATAAPAIAPAGDASSSAPSPPAPPPKAEPAGWSLPLSSLLQAV